MGFRFVIANTIPNVYNKIKMKKIEICLSEINFWDLIYDYNLRFR